MIICVKKLNAYVVGIGGYHGKEISGNALNADRCDGIANGRISHADNRCRVLQTDTTADARRAGWTLDESKTTHYTLHAFCPEECPTVFILPFQLLRKTLRTNYKEWALDYRIARQNSGQWQSECIFVPAPVVLSAIRDSMSS